MRCSGCSISIRPRCRPPRDTGNGRRGTQQQPAGRVGSLKIWLSRNCLIRQAIDCGPERHLDWCRWRKAIYQVRVLGCVGQFVVTQVGRCAEDEDAGRSARCGRFVVNSKNQTGEFDPGSERTLAACLTHASRTRTDLRVLVEWRTGE